MNASGSVLGLLFLAMAALLLFASCREAVPPWTGNWTSAPMPGYRLEYHLGEREFSMKMTDGSGSLVMASRGTLEIAGQSLLVTETSRLVESGDGRSGVWKSCTDIWKVEWSVDERGRLSWRPAGTRDAVIFDRKAR